MKPLGILISFALIGRVLVVQLEDYIKEVISTTEAIAQAKESMPDIIKNMVLNDHDYGTEAISYMLSVPDYIDVKLDLPDENSEIDEVYVVNQDENQIPLTQYRIPFINLVPGEGSSQNQNLDLNLDPSTGFEEENNEDTLDVAEILTFMPDVSDLNLDPSSVPEEGPGQNQIPDLNLDPSTVPEEVSTSENRITVRATVIHLEEKLKFQKNMKLEILAVTDRKKYEKMASAAQNVYTGPTPPDSPTSERKEVIKIKSENLASIIEKRRIRPSKVPKKRAIRSNVLEATARQRRNITMEAITSLIRKNDPAFKDNLWMMCRLAAAFRSIKYPHVYIVSVDILDVRYCALTDLTQVNEATVYAFVEGALWQVTLEGYALKEPFLSELPPIVDN